MAAKTEQTRRRMPSFNDHAHEILPGIWLGDALAASDDEWILRNRISVIFNCTKDVPFAAKAPCITQRYRLPVDDNLQASEIDNMAAWAAEAVMKAYYAWRAGNRLLIHCYAGRQRSAAIVAMLVILLLKKPMEDAMTFVRQKRPVAFFPAANFARAIQKFETDFLAATTAAIAK